MDLAHCHVLPCGESPCAHGCRGAASLAGSYGLMCSHHFLILGPTPDSGLRKRPGQGNCHAPTYSRHMRLCGMLCSPCTTHTAPNRGFTLLPSTPSPRFCHTIQSLLPLSYLRGGFMGFCSVAVQTGSSLRARPWPWAGGHHPDPPPCSLPRPTGDCRSAQHCLPSGDPQAECWVVTTVGSGSRRPGRREHCSASRAGAPDV